MSTTSTKVRLAAAVFVAVLLLAGAGAVVTRWALLPWALEATLKAAGASDVIFAVQRATPWRLELSGIGFTLPAARITAREASLERRHWWTPSLGKLKVTGARARVAAAQPGAASPAADPASAANGKPVPKIPLEEISIDGQLVIGADDRPEQALALTFVARPVAPATWSIGATLQAPGLAVAADLKYDLAGQRLDFATKTLQADLQTGQSWIESWAALPDGPWQFAGQIQGAVRGSYGDGQLRASGDLRLRQARIANPHLGLGVEGVEADVSIDDLAQFTLRAPGLTVAGEVKYDPAGQRLDFTTKTLQADLQTWQPWVEPWAQIPGGPWQFTGQLAGTVRGSKADGHFLASGDFQLRQAGVVNSRLGLAAEGVEADVDVNDLTQLLARQVTVRVARMTSGKLTFTDLATGFSRTEAGRFDVASTFAHALGGELRVEPFVYRLDDPTFEAVVLVDGVRAEQVMALTEDIPAQVTGSLSGRLPVRSDPSGLRFGTGWLGLTAGGSAEAQFHVDGLLTAGSSPKSANYAVLKQIESGLLKLEVVELRLDIRPPDAPAGRTARLHLRGLPENSPKKLPVTLDLNVNGPIEDLLSLGMKYGMTLGTKP